MLQVIDLLGVFLFVARHFPALPPHYLLPVRGYPLQGLPKGTPHKGDFLQVAPHYCIFEQYAVHCLPFAPSGREAFPRRNQGHRLDWHLAHDQTRPHGSASQDRYPTRRHRQGHPATASQCPGHHCGPWGPHDPWGHHPLCRDTREGCRANVVVCSSCAHSGLTEAGQLVSQDIQVHDVDGYTL